MTGDFNIRDNNWDLDYPYHSTHTDDLVTLAESLGLELSPPINLEPTRFVDNPHDSNSMIDLIFINPNNSGFGQHTLHPDLCKPSDHVPLIIEVGIRDTNIDNIIWSICKDSEEEENFITVITNNILTLSTVDIVSNEALETVVQHLASIFNDVWYSHTKRKCITKHSKEW